MHGGLGFRNAEKPQIRGIVQEKLAMVLILIPYLLPYLRIFIMPRRINFKEIENFRDIGGYQARYGETSFGVIYRSASLSYATKEDVDKIASLGIKTIIDLRDDEAKKTLPDKTSLDARFNTIFLPVNGNGRVPSTYEDGIDSYLEMLEDPLKARNIFKAIIHSQKPLLLHCTAGKDRTGCFIMMILLANGVDFDDINADYMASFPYLVKMTKNTREFHPEVPEVVLTPNINYLRDVYDAFLKEYGSLENYFEYIGLSDDEVKCLSSILGKQEKSCGAVVCFDNKVLVEHMSLGHYSIPKGHVEKNDKDEIDTARREIKEELGLEVDFIPSFRTSIWYSPFDGVNKEVVFYLAKAKNKEIKVDNKEVSDAYWISFEDCMRVLSFDSDRDVIKKAYIFAKANSIDL